MTEQERIEEKLRLESQFANGASWFYWIAGLTLINTIVSIFNGSYNFVSGLGITQIIDGIFYVLKDYFGNHIVYLGAAIDLIFVAIFFVLGILAHKKMVWSMILGTVLYGIDILSFLFVTDYLSIAFHALAIFSIIKGIQASKKLKNIEQIEEINQIEQTDSFASVTNTDQISG